MKKTKDPKIFIEHILESIDAIKEYTAGMKKEDFLRSREKQDCIIRRIEIIGEAVKSISPQIKKENHQIEWKQIAGMRDILIHEYFDVDLEYAWEVARRDILKLERELNKILKLLNK